MRGYGIGLAPAGKKRGVWKLLWWAGAGSMVLALLLKGTVFKGDRRPGEEVAVVVQHPCARIVSLAPSLTEVAFAVGLGEAVVAVSGYDTYPPSAVPLPKIGGALDASPERIASYEPTVVLALTEMADIVSALDKLGIPSLVVDHRSVSGILDSLIAIGRRCGVEQAAADLWRSRTELIEEVKRRDRGRGERVLVTVASASSLSDLAQVQLSGSDGFYAELIRFTGATSVINTPSIPLAQVSMEGIVAAQPTIIFEVFERKLSIDERRVRRNRWREWSMLPAAADDRIFSLDADYVGIPGPRFDKLLLDIERMITEGRG